MLSSQAAEQDEDNEALIKELIVSGLSITGGAATQDRSLSETHRYHTLSRVLGRMCLTDFVKWLQGPHSLNASGLATRQEHATLTLRILSNQITKRPELLLSTALDEPETPLYQWLLPCIIHAVAALRLMGDQDELADSLLAMALSMIRILGTHLKDDEIPEKYGRGVPRMRHTLESLLRILKGIGRFSSYPQYLFPQVDREHHSQIGTKMIVTPVQPLLANVKEAASVAVVVAQVLLTACTPTPMIPYSISFVQDIASQCLECLPAVWQMAQRHLERRILRAEVMRVVAIGLQFNRPSIAQPFLRHSIAMIQDQDNPPARQWSALSAFFENLTCPDLRHAFSNMAPSESLSEYAQKPGDVNSRSHAAACALKHIINLSRFDRELLQHWQETLAGRGGVWDDLCRALGHSQERGVKRKRDEGLSDTHRNGVLAVLRAAVNVPELSTQDMEQLSSMSHDEFVKIISQWAFAQEMPSASKLAHAKMLSSLFCKLACAEPCQGARQLPAYLITLWANLVEFQLSDEYTIGLLNAECQLLRHAKAEVGVSLDGQRDSAALRLPWSSMIHKERSVRLAAGRVLVQIHHVYGLLAVPGAAAAQRKLFVDKMAGVLSSPWKETAILVLGEVGRDEESMPSVLELLLPQLGASDSSIQAIAYTEVLSLCRHYGKAPYALMLPHIERVSILLASQLVAAPNIVSETMGLIMRTRKNFFETTVRYTLPALVVEQDEATLIELATIILILPSVLLVEHCPLILAKIFMTADKTDSALKFFVELIERLTQGHDRPVTAASVMTQCIILFLVELVMELGSLDRKMVATAESALAKAGRIQLATDLSSFLHPHMLGLVSHLNDVLQDGQGKKTVEGKRKVIRSLGALIKRVGGSMTSCASQIMAGFQGALEIAPLREETLRSWYIFVTDLKFGDIGPYIGATTAALVSNWAEFTPEERKIGKKTIEYLIVENAAGLSGFMDEVASVAHITELKTASDRLKHLRRDWSFTKLVTKILERSRSENLYISTRSVAELRDLLVNQRAMFISLARGDTFDPLVGQCMRHLFQTATRDGERRQSLRDLSYECIGILGALDPDRIKVQFEVTTMTLRSNFLDREESQDFALHLVRDVLVNAFRSTNDTMHQGHFAFAIQELLHFCGFTPKILSDSNAQIPEKIYNRWITLPKDQLETITPLLEGRFILPDTLIRTFAHPIYPTVATYREWLQNWTADLIGKIMSFQLSSNPADARQARAIKDSQTIFGVFRGGLRNEDVSVARHILPHMVLTVLCAGDAEAIHEIITEINAILEDQVNPQGGSPDRRLLCAQVVFSLMDHLSRWLLLSRQTFSMDKRPNDRRDSDLLSLQQSIRTVEKVIAAIETELTGNAALQSKAYERSLRVFEQRITQLRVSKRPDSELQTYFENLHHIYADLDEPDGMEGVSSMILAPTLQTQIREHESTGRWTSAQSCWEVRLQQKPDDVALHVGLMRCLRNLGHYGEAKYRAQLTIDTLRTHIRGVLSSFPEWTTELASFQVEAAWTVGDWEAVEHALQANLPQSAETSLARVLLAMRRKDPNLPQILTSARRELGAAVTASGQVYPRVYESVLSLHQLHEIEMIRDLENLPTPGSNRAPLMASRITNLTSNLDARYQAALPSYKVRESLLSMRRTAFGLSSQASLRAEIGLAWISSAKIARKTGHEQTAYSATLQARELDTPFAFVQQAKLLHTSGGVFKALVHLEQSLQPLLKQANSKVVDLTRDEQPASQVAGFDRSLAKAVLLEARWTDETKRFAHNDVILRFRTASELAASEESPHYHLGHFYDVLSSSTDSTDKWWHQYYTCLQYMEALKAGTKYIYQTMPRMLTLWLDMGESEDLLQEAKAAKKGTKYPSRGVTHALKKITSVVEQAKNDLPEYQWLTAYPQLVSRIGHANNGVSQLVISIVARVLARYPSQAVWSIVGVLQSTKGNRSKRCKEIVDKAIASGGRVKVILDSGKSVAATLLQLCDDPGTEPDTKGGRREVPKEKLRLSLAVNFPYVGQCKARSTMLPLQDALTCTLPTSATTVKTHNPFPEAAVEIRAFDDAIEVMPSLQKPKKIVFLGTDGKNYPFLCKPHDDLRKDARLMDFNSMINKLLNSASESRRRNLRIRTYAVMPLSEECGLLEWVPNTTALRSILEKSYLRRGIKLHSNKVYGKIEEARSRGLPASGEVFDKEILPEYSPAVFHEWFLMAWPEPSAWLQSRLAYARTLAVMSMIGFVLGLGDRHGENILFDSRTGDTVHVDFNCLFEKGKTFDIPERVPFRLTHNLVDALGVTGVEGVYRKAAEIAMEILRNNKDSLTSVLEAFVHDPLVEWEAARRRSREGKGDIRDWAKQSLQPIDAKLRGMVKTDRGPALSVTNQVETLIKQATDSQNLGAMYQGWAAWL